MDGTLWAIIVAMAWCFGFCAGIAWAAQFRPTRIEIHNRIFPDA